MGTPDDSINILKLFLTRSSKSYVFITTSGVGLIVLGVYRNNYVAILIGIVFVISGFSTWKKIDEINDRIELSKKFVELASTTKKSDIKRILKIHEIEDEDIDISKKILESIKRHYTGKYPILAPSDEERIMKIYN